MRLEGMRYDIHQIKCSRMRVRKKVTANATFDRKRGYKEEIASRKVGN